MSKPEYTLDLLQLTPKNLGQLKVLNAHCFPVNYGLPFYQQMLDSPDLSRLGYSADCLVAAIGCKLEGKRLYIMTLGVLEHYRRRGFAHQLLEWAISHAKNAKLSEIALHVQTNNSGALEFYSKSGFVIQRTDPNYYPQLDPQSAHYLVRSL